MEDKEPSNEDGFLDIVNKDVMADFILQAYVIPGLHKFKELLTSFLKGGGTAQDISDLVAAKINNDDESSVVTTVDGNAIPMPAISIARTKDRADRLGSSLTDIVMAHRNAVRSLASSSPSWELVDTLVNNKHKDNNHDGNEFVDAVFSQIRKSGSLNTADHGDDPSANATSSPDESIGDGNRMGPEHSGDDGEPVHDGVHHEDIETDELRVETRPDSPTLGSDGQQGSTVDEEDRSGVLDQSDGEVGEKNLADIHNDSVIGDVASELLSGSEADGISSDGDAHSDSGSEDEAEGTGQDSERGAHASRQAESAPGKQEPFADVGFVRKLEPNDDEPMFTEQGAQPEEALNEELDEDKLVRSLMLLGYSEEQAKVVLNKGAQVG
jgi:hypothetical protein